MCWWLQRFELLLPLLLLLLQMALICLGMHWLRRYELSCCCCWCWCWCCCDGRGEQQMLLAWLALGGCRLRCCWLRA
jgi:hypothetical protein